jgi:hypothetical protein
VVAAWVAAFLAIGGWYFFIDFDGTLNFQRHELEWKLFHAMWRNLLHWRFDIDHADMYGEEFRRNGKIYTYYGPFPAFVRGFLSLFMSPDLGGTPRISTLMAALIFVMGFVWIGFSLRLHKGATAGLHRLYLVTVVLATPVFVGLYRATVYNESQLWGTAWAGVSTIALLVYADARDKGRPVNRSLIVLALSGGLALLARLTTGVYSGVLFIGVLLLEGAARIPALTKAVPPGAIRPARWAVVTAVALFAACTLAQGVVNYERWGTPFEYRPLYLHQDYVNNERGRLKYKNGILRFDRIHDGLNYYFWPDRGHFIPNWPFIAMWTPAYTDVPYDSYSEPSMPLTISSPALLLFGLLGSASLLRRWTRSWMRWAGVLLVVAGGAVLLPLLMLDSLSTRYLMDVTPALAALGIVWLCLFAGPREKRTVWQRVAFAVLVPLVVWSVFGTYVTTMEHKLFGTGGGEPEEVPIVARLLGLSP